ncbi:apolipoprotein N-acyltransferase [Nonomuraea phyllanthi]|uniref:apolipoprotein N-acyltransferase n=1 Tax=Nonomuraea phyllanthi TaxID=2219224 RepID=UPI001D0289F2|nr:apolipoprotein N-acyltransferase [Nonomuraea phyllanthi]
MLPDADVPEGALPDAEPRDEALSGAAAQDRSPGSTAVPEAAVPEAAVPDAVAPDAVAPDAGLTHTAAGDAPGHDAPAQGAAAQEAPAQEAAGRGAADRGAAGSGAADRDATLSGTAGRADGELPESGTKPTKGDTSVPDTPAKGREGRWVLLGRVVAGVLGGIALYAAFPPLDWWLCSPLGIALIVLSLYGTRPRRAAWLGYLMAAVFLFPTLAWVRTIGDDVWLMLVGTESVFYAAMAALAALVFRLRAWPLWFAGLWVLMEWARGLVPIGGFPWARVAFSQSESLFTEYAALGGAPLVSFAVTLCGALLAQAVLAGSAPVRAREGVWASAGSRAGAARSAVWLTRSAVWLRGAPVAMALAVPLLTLAIPRPGDEGRTVNIGIVQGNVPGRGMGFMGDEPAVVLKNHANETKRLAQAVREGKLPKPDLVVLPENSTDIDPYRDAYASQIIQDSVTDVGVPTLIGAVVAIGDEHRATRSLVWDPVTGPGAYYDKQHLVPFGEYTPFKEIVLALWERANLVGRQSVAGDRPGDLRMGPVTVGAVNCYEVAYDDTVRRTVRAGGTPLVMQANNATYALSNLPPQQLAMYKLRAVEHNRAVVAAATTGISASIGPDGKVSWRTRELVADMNVVTVPVRTEETIATRVGAVPEWALMMMGAAAAGVAAWRGRRRGDRMRND